jgi:hypothetical protein
VTYAVASGDARDGVFRCRLSHIGVPSRFSWRSFAEMDLAVRNAHGAVRETTVPSAPDTFLHSLREAILTRAARTRRAIVYNGKQYTLDTAIQPDRRSGANMWRLNGSITEIGKRDAAAFQLWFDATDASGLPLRIEFHPKPFLKLVFEADRNARPAELVTRDGSPRFAQSLR